ncbi:MAG: hypothetical protein Q4C91_22620 [Eubacteriales bacterium]|nr:hypothetical protein [Eubacteriales bacterium]
MTNFIETNSIMISIVISLIGSLAAIFGAYYGRKAYRVAQDIFYKGIQMDTDKVLTQVGLEFTIVFIIPFQNFRNVTNGIWDDPHFDKQTVLYVKGVLEKSMFEPHFSYYEQHRGEIWDAVANCTEGQVHSFNSLRNFVEKAKTFDRGMNDLKESLDKYLGADGIPQNATMNDFFNAKTNINKGIFDRGLKLVNEIELCIKTLPAELNVEEKSEALRMK